MSDLVTRMLALRDSRGWSLADGLVRQAAKDTDGTVESLETRFRYVGVSHPTEVLRQLVQLRQDALAAAAPPAAPEPAAAVEPSPTWGGPPSWYRRPEQDEAPYTTPIPPVPAAQWSTGVADGHRPAAPGRSGTPPADGPDDAGPPSWYRSLHVDDAPLDPASATPPPSAAQPTAASTAATSPTPAGSAAPLTDDSLPDLAVVSELWDDFAESEGRLRVAVDGSGRTILHWSPLTAPDGLTPVYLVCGSAAAVPVSPDPASRVALTVAHHVVLPDQRHKVFAIFAYPVRAPADVTRALAVRHAVGRVLPEVADLDIDAAEHGVLVSWTRPRGIERVRVMRSRPDEPLPFGPDPSLQLAFSGDRFRDTEVEPGATYSYRVYTEAASLGGAGGSYESSPGLLRTVTVPGRPDAARDLRADVVTRDGRVGVSASWTRPIRGDVTVYLAPGAPDGDTVLGKLLTADQWALQESLLGARVREPVVDVEAAATDDGGADGERADTRPAVRRQGITWMPLDTHVDGGRHSQWTVTVVTEFAGVRVIGVQEAVLHVGDIEELQYDERVDWQLIRSSWPTGANFLGVWVVGPGEQSYGRPVREVTRDEFDQFGGIAIPLPPQPVDLLVQGYTRYGQRTLTGGQFRLPYPGRWVVRYELVPVGRFGSTRRLELRVDRPDWPGLSFMLVADQQGFPLSTDGRDVQDVARGELPASALSVGQAIVAAPEVKLPREASTRLSVWTSHGLPVFVVDPLPGPNPAPPVPPAPEDAVHCPRCLRRSELSAQYFRCEGTCPSEPDLALTLLRHPGTADPSVAIEERPVFVCERPRHVVRRAEVLDPPVDSAVCPRCQQVSHRHVCPQCHSDLPPHWWSTDVLGVTLVGARSTGKTTYLSELINHLERRILPVLGGHLQPIDADSQTKLGEYRTGYRRGELDRGTVSAGQNEALLRPMIAAIGQGQGRRHRALSLFDVAGEDMSRAETVRPYAPALASSDLLVLLIDPLQLNGVREWLQGTMPLPTQGDSAVTVVGNVVQEIRRLTGMASQRLPQRVAVVFAKFDGLQTAAKVPGSSVGRLINPGLALWRDPYVFGGAVYDEPDGHRVHEEVRSLLLAMSERTLVNLVESSFSHVQYFAVSALGHGPRGRQLSDAGASPQRVGDPLRWLLWSARWTG